MYTDEKVRRGVMRNNRRLDNFVARLHMKNKKAPGNPNSKEAIRKRHSFQAKKAVEVVDLLKGSYLTSLSQRLNISDIIKYSGVGLMGKRLQGQLLPQSTLFCLYEQLVLDRLDTLVPLESQQKI